jgi:hypothetical protein
MHWLGPSRWGEAAPFTYKADVQPKLWADKTDEPTETLDRERPRTGLRPSSLTFVPVSTRLGGVPPVPLTAGMVGDLRRRSRLYAYTSTELLDPRCLCCPMPACGMDCPSLLGFDKRRPQAKTARREETYVRSQVTDDGDQARIERRPCLCAA